VTSPAFDHGGRVIFLGDAAHAMSPQLGQGANLALWDAWALSRHMPRGDEAISDGAMDGAIHGAAMAWWRERRSHTRFYRLASRWMTPWFQSNWRVLGAVRDVCMYPASRVPWVRRQMVQSLAGIKTGLLSAMELPRA
jgi:2-polyprenyl-6-methoxyphenol hydroxylase-like FAD-dependent oxidoreductase